MYLLVPDMGVLLLQSVYFVC